MQIIEIFDGTYNIKQIVIEKEHVKVNDKFEWKNNIWIVKQIIKEEK